MQPFQSCLSRPGPSLLLSPHNPLIQPRLIYRRPLNPLRRSRISTLLPRGGHITRSRPLVGGGLDRRRPSLRLTRIHLPLLPLRGPIHRRQTQNAATIALTNAPFPHEWILVILKISRPVIQNPTTTPRVPPNIFVNPESLPTHPFQSCLKRLGPSLLLSPQNPLIQPLLIYPRPLNLLLLPSRSTPRLPPSLGVNTNPLSTQPSPSCRSRPGPSLLLSPRNPLIQPLLSYPRPLNPFRPSLISILLPGRDRTIPARGRVGGGLGRRRPSLRLTRIHLPRRPPLRGSTAHQPALPNTPNRRRNTLNTTHRRPGSTPQIRRTLQTCLPHLRRQLFGTLPRGLTGLQLGQTIPRGSMQRDRNLIHHQIKRHPLRRLHTHKHRSEQQRTHPLRSGQLQPRHLDLRPPLRLGKPPPIHRRQTQNAANIALTNTPLPHEWILVILKISRPVIQNPTTNRIIRRPSPHLTQTHRILSTARTLTPRQRRPRPPE